MNRRKEVLEYVKRYYLGEPIVTIMMDGGDMMDEYCIQSMVCALLKDFIDNPIPEGMKESSAEFNMWIAVALRRVMTGMDFGFSIEQEDAIKNLAWNYFVEGISKVQSDPKIKSRLFTFSRNMGTKQ